MALGFSRVVQFLLFNETLVGHFPRGPQPALDSSVLWGKVRLFALEEGKRMFTIQPAEKLSGFSEDDLEMRNRTQF